MSGTLLPRCEQRLVGVHPDLVRVVREARKSVPFVVTEGVRTIERQRELLMRGATRTLNSRHLTGHAVDLAYWLDDGDASVEQGEIRWDWPLYDKIGAAMKAAARRLDVKITWGGDWKSFRDGPHFELDWGMYPRQDT